MTHLGRLLSTPGLYAATKHFAPHWLNILRFIDPDCGQCFKFVLTFWCMQYIRHFIYWNASSNTWSGYRHMFQCTQLKTAFRFPMTADALLDVFYLHLIARLTQCVLDQQCVKWFRWLQGHKNLDYKILAWEVIL